MGRITNATGPRTSRPHLRALGKSANFVFFEAQIWSLVDAKGCRKAAAKLTQKPDIVSLPP